MFNFFRNNNNGRLIHYVKKTHNLPCGTFGNISDDLGVSINHDGFSPMVKMAYAYARRAVTAGLVYQGVFPVNQFIYVNGIFKSFQITTGHSVDFQEEAYEQAVELTLSYDRRLDKNMLSLLVAGAMDLVETNTEPQNFPGAPFSYEYVINFVRKFSNNL
ncbi:MAG: hypothetical protein UHD07_00740 [Ruminobacter sp.]|nr:hypothetical protein [Ruminobacter sp.]